MAILYTIHPTSTSPGNILTTNYSSWPSNVCHIKIHFFLVVWSCLQWNQHWTFYQTSSTWPWIYISAIKKDSRHCLIFLWQIQTNVMQLNKMNKIISDFYLSFITKHKLCRFLYSQSKLNTNHCVFFPKVLHKWKMEMEWQ